MSHWAEIDDTNQVIRVVVGDNNDPNGDEGYQWLLDNLGGTWVKTSYNAKKNGFRYNYAGIGYTWDGTGFAAPQPFPSWTLNSDSYLWEPPIPMPTDGKLYTWDEATKSWIEAAL